MAKPSRGLARGDIVTLLFTDLVGSTELLQALGDDPAEEVRRAHFRLLRDVVAAHGGHEVKNLGDGLMVAFGSALDALRSAIAMQRAVGQHNDSRQGPAFQIRVGLHAGEPARDEDDYFGTPVVVARRLCDAARGGQILASQLLAGLIGSRGAFGFRGVGALELKGLVEPVPAVEVAWQPDAAGSDSGSGPALTAGIRLLGAFEMVAADAGGPGSGRTVEIGSVKQRAVLAVLALRLNQVVSRDLLLDRLWGDRPPASATVTLRSLVSRLRKVLDGAGAGFELVTREPGWTLRADSRSVDATRFELLAADARVSLAGGDPVAAALTLRTALRLWRGDALSDVVDAGYLAAEATRLDEARLAAVEDLAEVELASGWPAEAVARLEPHVAANPLRERAWGQLMVALYHLGRQAESLRAYQRLRGILREELGINPTPALADLESRILQHDPALAPSPAAVVNAGAGTAAGARTPTDSDPGLAEHWGRLDQPEPEPDRRATMTAPPVGIGGTERTPFVGRAAERAILSAAIERARAGSGGMVLIGGEPGIGKTRLAEEAAAEAAGLGMRVLAGHSYERAGASPYVAVVEILEAALAAAPSPEAFLAEILGDAAPEVARLLPQLRRRFPDLPAPLDMPPAQERQYLFRCLSESFARLAQARPTLVLLDDLQWVDEPSLLFVERLAAQLPGKALLVVATYRDTDVDRPLARTFGELHRRRLVARIKLGPLTPGESGELVAGLAGQDPPPALVDALHTATEGNAFFLEEIFRDLAESGQAFDTAGRFCPDVDIDDLGLPEGVRLVIGRRLDRLSDGARRALTIAALAGRVFSVALLQTLGDVDGDDLLDALDEGEQAFLIAPTATDDEFLFAHELIRQTLAAGLSGLRRRRAHLRIAEAMIAVRAGRLDEHAAEIAHQLSLAGEIADHKGVLTYSLLAGQRALATSAFEEAAAHLDRAVACDAVATDVQRAELFYALGRAHRALGRQEEAFADWERAVGLYEALGDAEAVGRTCRDVGVALLYAGRVADGHATLRRGLAALGEAVSADRAVLLSAAAIAMGVAGDADQADAYYEQARRVAGELGDEVVAGLVAMERSLACHPLMGAEESVETGLQGAAALRAAGELWAMADGLWATGWNLVCLGRFAESAAVIEEFAAVVQRVGHPLLGLQPRVCGPREFYRSGDLDAFEAAIRRDIELFEELLGGAWTDLACPWMGTARFLRGDWEQAERWFRRAIDTVTPSAYAGTCWAAWFLYLVFRGRKDEALVVFEAHRGELGLPGLPATTGGWALLFAFTEGLFLLGERDLVAGWEPLVVEAQRRHGVKIAPYAPGQLVERVAAIAATAAGDHDLAEAHFLCALSQADELPHQFERLESRRYYAQMLTERRAPGDAEKARTLLEEAASGFSHFGMPHRAEAAAAALRAL